MNVRICAARAAVIGMLLATSAVEAAAQGTCEVNNVATCTAGGTAAQAITITISTVARLTSLTSSLVLPVPDANQFDAGFGTALSVALSVRANTTWTLGIRGGQALWTATPGTARQNKPVGDLQWATSSGGPWTNLTTLSATFGSGTATAASAPGLFLRGRFGWAVDSPGNYSIPVQVLLTAP